MKSSIKIFIQDQVQSILLKPIKLQYCHVSTKALGKISHSANHGNSLKNQMFTLRLFFKNGSLHAEFSKFYQEIHSQTVSE